MLNPAHTSRFSPTTSVYQTPLCDLQQTQNIVGPKPERAFVPQESTVPKSPAYPGIETLCLRYVPRYTTTVDAIYWLAATLVATDKRFQYGFHQSIPEGIPPTAQTQSLLMGDKKLCAKLTQDLVGLLKRPRSELTTPTASYHQHCGHIAPNAAGTMTLHEDVTLSSVAIKKDSDKGNKHLQCYNANLAKIVSDGKLICGRSARSDSPQKLEELLVFNALSSLQAAKGSPDAAVGFHADPATGESTFQMTLLTAMDRSFLKSLFTRLTPRGEDERHFIANLEASIEKLFKGHQRITRVVTVNGVPQQLQIARPLLLNITLSGQSKLQWNISRHRKANRKAIETLTHRLCDSWLSTQGLKKGIAESIKEALATGSMAAPSLWNSAPFKLSSTYLSRKHTLILDLIQLVYTGQTSTGKKLLDSTDPGIEFILLSYLLDETNQALSVQCKSGQDRTLTLASLQVARAAFEKERGEVFDPFLPDGHGDTLRFRELFTDAANTFGPPMIRAVRGHNSHHGVAKWGSHPVPLSWYNVEQDPTHPIGI